VRGNCVKQASRETVVKGSCAKGRSSGGWHNRLYKEKSGRGGSKFLVPDVPLFFCLASHWRDVQVSPGAASRLRQESPRNIFLRPLGGDSDLREHGLCLARKGTAKGQEAGAWALSHESSPYCSSCSGIPSTRQSFHAMI
jgi:hypothetical protein